MSWRRSWLSGGSVVVVALLAWEAAVRLTDTPAYLVPAPSEIAATLVEELPDLMPAAGTTLGEALAGLVIGGGLGLALAVVITFWRGLEYGVMSLALLAKSTPVIAVAPILTIWLGYGHAPKVVVTALLTFFPVLVNALEGFRSVDPAVLAWLRSIDASRTEIFREARVPTATPHLFAALRISAPLAMVGAVVAEWMGAAEGLGRQMWLAYTNLDMPSLFAAVVVLTVLSALVYRGVTLAESRLIFWRTPEPNPIGQP